MPLLGACGDDGGGADVEAYCDLARELEAPDAGAVSFVMTNDGTEPHMMGISKLREGVSPEEATQAEATPEVTEFAIASDVTAPGEEVVLTFENLEAGGYRMVCFITAPHGEPHAVKGMSVPFTVE